MVADAGCTWVVADAGCSWVVAYAGCSLKATAQAFEGKFAAVTSSAGQLAARGAGPDVAAAASSCFQAAAFQNEQERYFPFHSKNFQLLLPQFSDSSSVSCYLLSAEQFCGDLDPMLDRKTCIKHYKTDNLVTLSGATTIKIDCHYYY